MNDGGDNVLQSFGIEVVARKSWVAYVAPLIFYPLTFYLLSVVASYTELRKDYLVYLIMLVLLLFVYHLVVIYSHKLFINDEGIWYTYGVLPWAKGGDGIRWRDADMPKYYPGFVSWITNSYHITVSHKYTNKADFQMTQVWAGRQAVARIHSEINSRIS